MKKRFLLSAAAAVCAATLSGCSLFSFLQNSEPRKNLLPQKALSAEELAVAYSGYGYSALNTLTEKRIYAAIDAAMQEPESREFATAAPDDINRVNDILEFYKADHPEVFWIDETEPYYYSVNDGTLTMRVHFKSEGEALLSAKERLENALADAAESAPDDSSEYERELYIHDYLIGHCEYDDEAVELHQQTDSVRANEQNAYGAMVEGKAVCEGYARAFQLLCDRLEVPCWVIQGQALGFEGEANVNHIWNCVRLDGEWYFVDVTWDDCDSRETIGAEQYFYFNLTTDELLKDHVIAPNYSDYSDSGMWYNGFVPECDSVDYYYFYLNAKTIHDLDSDALPAYLASAAAENAEYCVFEVGPELDFDDICDRVLEEYAYRWIGEANELNDYFPYIGDNCKMSSHEPRRLITILLSYE